MPSTSDDKKNKQIQLLADRLAIALVVLKQRHGTDWNPWFREGLWDEEDGLGDQVRSWPEFKEAKGIVRLFLTRQANQERGLEKEKARRGQGTEVRETR